MTKWLLRLARWCNHCNQLIRFQQLQPAETKTKNRFVFLLDTSSSFEASKTYRIWLQYYRILLQQYRIWLQHNYYRLQSLQPKIEIICKNVRFYKIPAKRSTTILTWISVYELALLKIKRSNARGALHRQFQPEWDLAHIIWVWISYGPISYSVRSGVENCLELSNAVPLIRIG